MATFYFENDSKDTSSSFSDRKLPVQTFKQKIVFTTRLCQNISLLTTTQQNASVAFEMTAFDWISSRACRGNVMFSQWKQALLSSPTIFINIFIAALQMTRKTPITLLWSCRVYHFTNGKAVLFFSFHVHSTPAIVSQIGRRSMGNSFHLSLICFVWNVSHGPIRYELLLGRSVFRLGTRLHLTPSNPLLNRWPKNAQNLRSGLWRKSSDVVVYKPFFNTVSVLCCELEQFKFVDDKLW